MTALEQILAIPEAEYEALAGIDYVSKSTVDALICNGLACLSYRHPGSWTLTDDGKRLADLILATHIPDDEDVCCMCRDCQDSRGEAAWERRCSDYYGGSGPMTLEEQCRKAWEGKHGR